MDLSESERRWLRIRRYARGHHHELAEAAARDYPTSVLVEGTPLLSTSDWLPAEPVLLRGIDLRYDAAGSFDGVTGFEPVARSVLPKCADGSCYHSYSEVVGALAAPRIFENRPTYRLLAADLTAGRIGFGSGRYFDGIDVGDACAHEYAAAMLDGTTTRPLRDAIGDLCDPGRRRTNLAISTLTLRLDHTGPPTFLLHRRDPTTVGHAAGMYQVLPVGVFQPATENTTARDFSLWHCMIREYAEELLNAPEARGPIDYDTWHLATAMTDALHGGTIRAHCLAIGVDPLSLATDLLTVVTIEAPTYDQLFGQPVTANAEGQVFSALPFTADTLNRLTGHEPMQAAGAALLRLAWRHRRHLLG